MNFTREQFDDHQRRHGFAVAGVTYAPESPALPPKPSRRIDAKAERELQSQIKAFLTQHRQKGTVRALINPPMNKRSHLPLGWPDFTFAYLGKPIALEVKMPGKKPEPHQLKCHEDMRADGWAVHVVHSVDEAASVFDAVDAESI